MASLQSRSFFQPNGAIAHSSFVAPPVPLQQTHQSLPFTANTVFAGFVSPPVVAQNNIQVAQAPLDITSGPNVATQANTSPASLHFGGY
jgi:hypothetical protein